MAPLGPPSVRLSSEQAPQPVMREGGMVGPAHAHCTPQNGPGLSKPSRVPTLWGHPVRPVGSVRLAPEAQGSTWHGTCIHILLFARMSRVLAFFSLKRPKQCLTFLPCLLSCFSLQVEPLGYEASFFKPQLLLTVGDVEGGTEEAGLQAPAREDCHVRAR